jgi:alginate O-acetyltransferase complex protein AlgJ
MDRPSRRPRDDASVDPVVRCAARHLSALGFAALLAIGTLATLANPALRAPPGVPVWDGSWADSYQRALDAASPLLGPSRTVWGVIDLLLFGQGRPGVLVGREGWLYSAEEFDVVADAPAAIAAWTGAIAEAAALLAQHDIELVVALVPSKAGMVPDFAPAPLPDAARSRYETALGELRASGVVAPDLRLALAAAAGDGPVYLRTDTHWTPHGAAAAARAIARAVGERTTFDGLGEQAFVTETLATEPLLGDLSTFLDLGPLAGRIGPPPDTLEIRQTLSLAEPGKDLFAEVRLPVALVGTSYSADPRWNLAGALRDALGVDVHEAAVSGIGPLQPLERYLDSAAFVNTPPEVIVWEIPERYLTLEDHVPGSTGR